MHFITKYALTEGIKVRDDLREDEDGYAYGRPGFEMFKLGRDCFRDHDAAVKAAEKMRGKKVASLEEQIARVRALTFR